MEQQQDDSASQNDWQHRGLPPEMVDNCCHITPEMAHRGGQKLWFVNAPYGGSLLRFRGEPTSLLYAVAPLIDEVKRHRISGLAMEDIALLNPVGRSERFYSELRMRLQAQGPSLRAIGISTMTAGCPEARRIAALAKEVNPNTIIIFGGPHEDDITEKSATDLRYTNLVDFSVAGDGEFSLLTLMRILFENPSAGIDESKAAVLERQKEFVEQRGRGSVFFQHDGRTRQLILQGGPLRLDDLPRMPRELLHESDTRTFSVFKRGGWNVKTAQILTHRGCYWRCNFCSESGSLTERSVESVVAEIEEVRRFKSIHPHLGVQNYEAVFFDDSTFTNNSPNRKRYLEHLFRELRRIGVEWGCQTRLDQLDFDTLTAMKAAGCSYIYTGLESASNELLRAMVKDEDRTKIDSVFADIERVGMRVGVSLVFGAVATGSDETAETGATIQETLTFVERQATRGNVVLVSPNLATYYPGTRMTLSSRTAMDFHNPIVNPGFPWNRFEEGEGYHPRNLTSEMGEKILNWSIEKFGEHIVEQDLYALEDYQYAYRNGILDDEERAYADLNHASISPPNQAAAAAAWAAAQFHAVSDDDAKTFYESAREAAAALMGLPSGRSENVVLARNATEAASLCLWLSGVCFMPGTPRVLTTEAENFSIPRAFRFFMDHGNSGGHDLWSSFQDFAALREPRRFADRQPTGITVDRIPVLKNLDNYEEEILSGLSRDTRLVVFSHVIRDTGRICKVADLCTAIRRKNQDTRILVDGAQALGALPLVNFESLGCDYYVAAPHKTLGSFPLGLLYMSEAAKARLREHAILDGNSNSHFVVMPGMFADSLDVKATTSQPLSLPEVAGFARLMKALRGHVRADDCSALDTDRRRLKAEFLKRLTESFPEARVFSPSGPLYTNFIASFQLPGRDNREVVERLWREYLIFASFIARVGLIRFSFGLNSRLEDVGRAVEALAEICQAQDDTSAAKISRPGLCDTKASHGTQGRIPDLPRYTIR